MDMSKELKSFESEVKSEFRRYMKHSKRSKKSGGKSTRQLEFVDIDQAIGKDYHASGPTTFIVGDSLQVGIIAVSVDMPGYQSPESQMYNYSDYDPYFTISYRNPSGVSGSVEVASNTRSIYGIPGLVKVESNPPSSISWKTIELPNWTAVPGTQITVSKRVDQHFTVQFALYTTTGCWLHWYNLINRFLIRDEAYICTYSNSVWEFAGVDGTPRIKGLYITDKSGNPILNTAVTVNLYRPNGTNSSSKLTTNQYGYLFLGLEKSDMQKGGLLTLGTSFKQAYFQIDS